MVGAGIAESDGTGDSACGCGGEEGEEGRKAAVGIGGGRVPGLREGLGGEREAEGGQGEEHAAGPGEAEEGGGHGWRQDGSDTGPRARQDGGASIHWCWGTHLYFYT